MKLSGSCNTDALYADLLESLNELDVEKEKDETCERAWDILLSSMLDDHIQIIHNEFEALREARANGEIYHINKLAQEAAQRVASYVTMKHQPAQRAPLGLPPAVAEAYLYHDYIAIRICDECKYQYPQIIDHCPMCNA